jgi:hypothetical protein
MQGLKIMKTQNKFERYSDPGVLIQGIGDLL